VAVPHGRPNKGGEEEADWWATATVPGGGTGWQAGPSGTLSGSTNSKWIQNISNGFKFAPNFDRSKKVPSHPWKIGNKICMEGAWDEEQLLL
jgi:hypothetical protein